MGRETESIKSWEEDRKAATPWEIAAYRACHRKEKKKEWRKKP